MAPGPKPKGKEAAAPKVASSNSVIADIKSLFTQAMPDLSLNAEKTAVIRTPVQLMDTILGGGFIQGGFHMLIGSPGSGKSTLAVQMLAQSLRESQECIGIYMDSEQAMANKRLEQLGVDLSKVIIMNQNITVESVFKSIDILCKYKEEHPNTKELPFTIIWDSIAFTPSERELKAEDINETIGYKARLLSQTFPKYLGKLVEYNITLIGVNQLREKISMGMFHAPADLRWMGEKDIPGGQALKFLAFQLVHLQAKTDAKAEMYGENGLVVQAKAIKNKNFPPNVPVEMIVSFNSGFDNFLTNMLLLKEKKMLVAGAWNYLEHFPSKKFRTKDAKELYRTDEVFKAEWDKAVQKALDELLETHRPVIDGVSPEQSVPESVETQGAQLENAEPPSETQPS